MYRFGLLLVFYCNVVFCQDCVTENFENGIADFRSCYTHPKMVLREYSAFNMISPHPRSTKFVTPASNSSGFTCLQSIKPFTVIRGGTLEVNRYTTSKNTTDRMIVRIITNVTEPTGSATFVVSDTFGPGQSNFVPGWETFRMTVPRSGIFQGFVRFAGMDPGSMIVIDSFRFISPTYNKDLCKIYDDSTTTTSTTTSSTTKEPQTTSTTQRATESPTTSTTISTTTMSTTTVAPSTSTQAPRLSISLQNKVKDFKLNIKKFFK